MYKELELCASSWHDIKTHSYFKKINRLRGCIFYIYIKIRVCIYILVLFMFLLCNLLIPVSVVLN